MVSFMRYRSIDSVAQATWRASGPVRLSIKTKLYEYEERRNNMKISARNQIKGKIVNIQEGAVNAIVTLDIGGGNKLTSTISIAAVKELGLKVGEEAYAVIKATSVMMAVD